jgi:hypothetical protein
VAPHARGLGWITGEKEEMQHLWDGEGLQEQVDPGVDTSVGF